MKKRAFRKRIKDRRGFSLAEVVVGLTVVVMVSAAALNVIMASIQMEAKYLNETTALCACESVVACVRFSDDAQDLAYALADLTEGGAQGEGVIAQEVDGKTVYELKQNTVRISVVFDYENFDTFEITAVKQNGETIHQVTYEKN